MNNNDVNFEKSINCPLPVFDNDKIMLSHGSGGILTNKLIKDIFLKHFDNAFLNVLHDGAILNLIGNNIAFTTDSYVVNPLFFPGGDIGSLSVNGTVNDLAMCGARPVYISTGFIIEEGFSIAELDKIAASMKNAANIAGVQIVTGDTKVVEHGKGDKIFINTSGIGIIDEDVHISPQNCSVGDNIIINGKIAEHGIAIISSREGFQFESEICSDCSPLNELVEVILNTSKNVHTLRDPTRGGIAGVLNEIATSANVEIIIDENKIPISQQVNAACEIIGFDPLYIANEGKVIVFVSQDDTEKVLNAMKLHPLGKESSVIGKVTAVQPGLVKMRTAIGSMRIVDMPYGEQLPRIC